MPFTTLLFLSCFLPIYMVVVVVTRGAVANWAILALSVLFYLWGAPTFLPVILALGVLDFAVARFIHARRGQPAARYALIAVIVVHVAILAYFKYANFFVGQLNEIRDLFGYTAWQWSKVILPIGVSFLTFEEISFMVDVYRGHAVPPRTPRDYWLFLMLFPHSIAGPIFRWKDLERQLRARTWTLAQFAEGTSRFCWGLGKKLLVGDALAIVAKRAFDLPHDQLTGPVAWVGAVAYTIHIYFDFSGYSDMAIGLGKMAGFTFKENFRDPYTSKSVTEFWARWHISLSTWFRDYVYIPLGGNRAGERRTRVNIALVFAISGFWHGASWTFLAWGAYHGAWVVLERVPAVARLRARVPSVGQLALTLLLVVFGWVLFRAESFAQAGAFMKAMVGLGPSPSTPPVVWGEFLPRRSEAFALVAFASIAWRVGVADRVRDYLSTPRLLLAPVVLAACFMQVLNASFVPLIYFKF
ncbi:MAG: MBOAT family O-acyltransferase [Kofleriaceae bacterium]